MKLDYSTQEKNGVLILSLKEEKITHDNSPFLKESLILKITEGHAKIILDLSKVTEIDSSGLGALLFGKRQASSVEGELRLAGASESVQNMIRIAQLSRVFEMHNSIEDALKAFK